MNIKERILKWESGTNLFQYWMYLFVFTLYKTPLLGFFWFSLNLIYSYVISFKMFGFSYLPKVGFSGEIFRVNFKKTKGSEIHGCAGIVLVFEKWNAGNSTNIIVGNSARLIIENKFTIGDGCKIQISPKAKLLLSGDSSTQSSGITCNSIILCSEYIEIGKGSIISWNCYISDSSQHQINSVVQVQPVIIGEHVWLSESVTCAPGCIIGKGSIVGSKSFVNKEFSDSCFLAGVPAVIVKKGVVWSK